MSGFTRLRDVSNKFEYDIRQTSNELHSTQIGDKFEENVAKKMKNLTLFSSKLKLLNAKHVSTTPQILEHPNYNALQEYGDTVAWKVLEQCTVKSLTQTHAVKALITAPDSSLDAELVDRKNAIIESLTQFRNLETQLRHLNQMLTERESVLASKRAEWDCILGDMRDLSEQQATDEGDSRGPLYQTLSNVVEKLEMMRWLVGRLVCARGPYDWLVDPHRRRAALPLTRQHHTIDMFVE